MLAPWNTEKTEINLLNTVRIFLSEQLFKGWHCFTDTEIFCIMAFFFNEHRTKHRNGFSVRTSTQPGVTALPVCPRLPQPFRLFQSWTFGTFKVHNSNIFQLRSNSRTGDPRSVPAPDSNRRLVLGSPGTLWDFHSPSIDWMGLYILDITAPFLILLCCWHEGCREIWIWDWEEGRGWGRCIFFFKLCLIILFWLLIGRKLKLD